MSFLKFFWAFVAFVSITVVHAQIPCTVHVKGKVVDRSTGKGLAYATVVELRSSTGAAADAEGNFQLDNLCVGTVRMQVSHVGCATESFDFYLKNDSTITLYLSHQDSELEAFEVVEDVISSGELTRLEVRGARLDIESGKQIAEMAQLLPGMRMLQTGNAIAKPVFRGMHSNRLLLMNNGIRQEGQYWGAEHAPEIDSYIARQLAVIEGVDALRYASDAIVGVLLVEPADVFGVEKFGGRVQSALQTNGRGGSVAGELQGLLPVYDGLHYRVQGSLKKLGTMRDSQNFLTNTGIEEWNFSYALGYKWKRWEAEVFYSNFNQRFGLYRYSHLGNLTDLEQVLQGRQQPDTSGFTYQFGRPFQRVSHELFKARVQYTINDASRLEFIYARQYNSRQEYDVHIGRSPSQEALARPQLDYGLTTHLAEALWHHERGNFSGKVGASALLRRNRFRGRNFMPNYENQNFGVFGIESVKFGLWTASYGLRYDHYRASIFEPVASLDAPVDLNFDGIATSFALQRKLEKGELTLSLSTQWRAPAVNELYSDGLHHGAGGIEVGNSELGAERSFNSSVGYKATFGKHHLHGIAYANYIRDFIFMNPTSVELTIRGAFPRFDFASCDALFGGVDLRYDATWNAKWSTSVSASLVLAQNMDNNSYFIGIPPHRFELSAKRSFEDFKRFKGLYLGIRGSYTMRQYRAPDLYPFQDVRNLGSAAELPESFDFAAPPDAYFLLGADAGFRIGNSTFSLNLENALNTAYRDYMNRFRYFADEMGINLFLRFQHFF